MLWFHERGARTTVQHIHPPPSVLRQPVRIMPKGRRGIAMTQLSGDVGQRCPFSQEQARKRMAEIVRPVMPDAGLLESSAERIPDRISIKQPATGDREEPRRLTSACLERFGAEPGEMALEDRGEVAAHLHVADASRLRRLDRLDQPTLRRGPRDADRAALEIDIFGAGGCALTRTRPGFR